MKYRFYYLDNTLIKHTIATLNERSPISVVARKLHDLAFKWFGRDARIVHDATMVGGYYADPDGNVVAVELDYEGKR